MLLEFPFGGNSNSNAKLESRFSSCYFSCYQRLISTRLFSVGKGKEERGGGSGGSPATVSRGEELSKMEKKHGSPIKSIFYGRATGRVTTMANNNTLLWAHPTNVTPTPRDDYPRVTRCTGWFIAIIFLFSGSPPMKWAVFATGGGGKRIGRAEEDTGGHTGTYVNACTGLEKRCGDMRRGVDEDTPPICPPFSDPIPRPNATLPSYSIEAMARVQTG